LFLIVFYKFFGDILFIKEKLNVVYEKVIMYFGNSGKLDASKK